jgi:oxygen-independent coproporphyrinogen-3 oxidase
LNDEDLKFLGRKHDLAQALAAIETAGQLFERFSFDLIYARPGQTMAAWQAELEYALHLQRGHLSLYQLTIERSTPFYLDHAQGKFVMPDDGVAADFYNLTQDITEQGGLPVYEVSNHAQAGHESVHNLIYWQYGDYIGIGPGAHGRLTIDGQKYATREHAAPDIWMQRVREQGFGYNPFVHVPPAERFAEALMMGLRLPGGVSVAKLEAEGQCSFDALIDLTRMETAITQGWMAYDQSHLILTREGMLRLNALLPFLLK